MKWLPRLLWLAAWSVWLYLGLGLHRELPRLPGPMLASLPIEPRDTLLGFAKNSPYVVVQSISSLAGANGNPSSNILEAQPRLLKIYDGLTGALTRQCELNSLVVHHDPQACRRHGVLFSQRSRVPPYSRSKPSINEGFHAYDVLADRWIELSDREAVHTVVHPTKPWIAFTDFGGRSARRPAVFDWSTGVELLARPSMPSRGPTSPPLFLGDTDRLIVTVWTPESEPRFPRPAELEIWKIGSPSRLEKTVCLPAFGSAPEVSSNGRLASGYATKTTLTFDVIDLETERSLFSVPRAGERPSALPVPGGARRMALSKSGRTILGGNPLTLWDIDVGAPIWTPDSAQEAQPNDDRETFSVVERWPEHWIGARFKRWNTVARRDLETGRLKLRCWEHDRSILSYTNANDTLAVSPSGAVHRLPFLVNYPLLALCQSILALPLILLWCILRWRRSRRTRLAEAAL